MHFGNEDLPGALNIVPHQIVSTQCIIRLIDYTDSKSSLNLKTSHGLEKIVADLIAALDNMRDVLNQHKIDVQQFKAQVIDLQLFFLLGSCIRDSQFTYRWCHSPMASVDPRVILDQNIKARNFVLPM